MIEDKSRRWSFEGQFFMEGPMVALCSCRYEVQKPRPFPHGSLHWRRVGNNKMSKPWNMMSRSGTETLPTGTPQEIVRKGRPLWKLQRQVPERRAL